METFKNKIALLLSTMTRHTGLVFLASLIAFIGLAIIFFTAPTGLTTAQSIVTIISAILLVISWFFLGRNAFFVLSAINMAMLLINALIVYPLFSSFWHIVTFISALIGFNFAVVSVHKYIKARRELKKQNYYTADEKKPRDLRVEKVNVPVVQEKITTKKVVKEAPVKKTTKKVAKKTTKKVSTQPTLSFYDVKDKKNFKSNKYTFKTIKGRRFAVAKSPSGTESYRIVGATKATKKRAQKTEIKKIARKEARKIAKKQAKQTAKKTSKKIAKKAVKKAPKKKVTKKTVKKSPAKKAPTKVVNKTGKSETVTTSDGRDIIININEN